MGKRQFLILLIFIILLISGVQYSVADDTSPKDNPTERESIILDNVPDTLDALLQRSMKSVTGAKREQLNDESPSFVSVITAKISCWVLNCNIVR
jgi:hypothetical protein